MLTRSPQRMLLAAISLFLSAGLVFNKELDLWFVPMSQEGPQTPGLLAWAKEHFPKDLPKGVSVPGNYGPPIYQDAQQKFIVQGRRGKPDVIEGVLEGMIAYQKAGLITPIDDLFNQWPWELIKLLCSKDFVAMDAKLEGINPPRQDVADLPDFKSDWWQQAFTQQISTGVALAPINWGLVVNDITEALQKVIYQNNAADKTGQELYNTLQQRRRTTNCRGTRNNRRVGGMVGGRNRYSLRRICFALL
jgi:hypothetical protein